MLKALKIRRAAAQLTEAFPEISVDTALDRARRMIAEYPRIGTDRLAEYLVHGERVARMFEEIVKNSHTEEAA
jgi:hypothetical protein